MSTPREAARSLRPGTEEVWDRIRAGFALHEGFWLGVLFGLDSGEVVEFVARSRDLARGRAQRVDEIALTGVEGVRAALGEMVGAPMSGLYATWLTDGGTPTDRDEAWAALLRRLNERRDVLREMRPAAVLLCCPPGALDLVRDNAPDLWSFRSLTATVDMRVSDTADRSSSVPVDQPAGEPRAASSGFAPVAGPPVEPSVAVAPLLRRAARALAAGRVDNAILAAREALAAADGVDDEALAHAWLARARAQQGEELEAQRHARLALGVGRALGPENTRALLGVLAGSDDPEVAQAAATATATDREAAKRSDGSPSALRTLAKSLRISGAIAATQGKHDVALASFVESLDLARRIHTTTGDTPSALRDLSVSLRRLGDIQRALGRLDAAFTSYTESLDLARRIHTTTGDTPETLRDLSQALNRLGNVQTTDGRLDEALASHTESLDLARRIHTTTGDTLQNLRGLAVLLNCVGDVQTTRGQLDAALATYTESLELARRIHTATGDTPAAVRDLSHALNRIGDIQQTRGLLDAALATYTDSLDLARRIHTTTGDTPETLRDLSYALLRVGDIQQTRGRLDAALATYTEFLDLTRRIRTTSGDTPDSLRDLSISLSRVGDIQTAHGRLDAALITYAEALDIDRMLRRTYGESPVTLLDLRFSPVRLARIEEERGRTVHALALYREALDADSVLRDQFGPPHWDPAVAADLQANVDRLSRETTL